MHFCIKSLKSQLITLNQVYFYEFYRRIQKINAIGLNQNVRAWLNLALDENASLI